jgi:methyltransferase
MDGLTSNASAAALGPGAATTFTAFLVVLALMGAARVAELLVAKRLTAQARTRGEAPKREPIFVVMVLLHTLPFVLAPLEVIVFDRPFVPALFVACTVALVLLGLGRVWTLRTLGSRWNVRIVQPDVIVAAGPYRFIRHPNYAIVICELFVLPLVHTAWVTCIVLSVLNAFVLAMRIPAEERVLFEVAGYREAMGTKARFIPGVF